MTLYLVLDSRHKPVIAFRTKHQAEEFVNNGSPGLVVKEILAL